MSINYKFKNLKNQSLFTVAFLIALAFNGFSQFTYTFTNCGATGSLGPTQAQVNSSYTLTNLSGSVVVTSTGIQTWTVPATGLYRVVALGASSGQNSNTTMLPGKGTQMEGDFNLNAGDVLQILVGQMGENHPSYAAGGGGGTFVTKVPHNTLASILVIAGGGGAPSGDFPGLSAVTATCGTFDVQSGPGQCNGDGGISFTGNSGGGGGGFFTDGANNATVARGGKAYVNGGAGALTAMLYVRGGFGGGGGNESPATSTYASSGGGGFSGGNGGNRSSTVGTGRMGGGGGGSYNNGTNQINAVLTNTGHGLVVITRLCNITLGTNTGNNILCQGAAVTLTTDAISSYTWSTGSNASAITVSPNVTTTYSLTAMSPSNCITSAAITISVSSAAPVLTITASTNSICLGNTVSIAASGALSYTFSGGISNNVSFTPVATSTYVVQGQNGCGTSSTAVTITVSALPVVAITSTNVVCAGSTATLSGGGATTYTWQPGNLVGASVVVAPQNNTTYTVLGFTGACGGINTVSVSTNPVPSLTVTVSHFTLCAGESSTITATGASSYTWTPGGLGSSIVVSPLIPTSYIVVGENSFGCTSSAQQGVVAYAGPNMNIAASNTLICAGGVVTLNSSGATTYLWNTGATTAITTATPASTTVYTVVGSAPGNPCSTTKTIEINVFTATISVSSPTAICLGESTTLTASGANTYNWSNGGSGSSISVNPTSTTIYTVNGVSSMGSGTCASSAITEVTVNPLPSVVAASSRTNICRTESTEITVSGANTYSWSTSSTATSIVVSPTIQTTYTVLGTDANGCKNTGSILIRVFGCLGLEENAAAFNAINIYPNPSTGEFNISAEQNMRLVLINELGQLVKEIELNAENAYSAEIKGLSKGVYFINSKNAELQFNKKIVVQ